MKEMIIPDERLSKRKGKIQELENLKIKIRFSNFDDSDETGEAKLMPNIIHKFINECMDIMDELSETVEFVDTESEEDNINTSKEQIKRITEILKEKYETNSNTRNIIDTLSLNKNYLTISIINYMDYVSSGINSKLEESKRRKAINSNYRKVFYDKGRLKYDKKIFWSMIGTLIACTGIFEEINKVDNINTIRLLKRK